MYDYVLIGLFMLALLYHRATHNSTFNIVQNMVHFDGKILFSLKFRSMEYETKRNTKMENMTNEQKHQQILKEVKATFILIAIVAAWHIGFGFLLEDVDILILGMPLWFFVSTIGAFAISAIGVIFLVKKIFKDFDLGDEMDEEGGDLVD